MAFQRDFGAGYHVGFHPIEERHHVYILERLSGLHCELEFLSAVDK